MYRNYLWAARAHRRNKQPRTDYLPQQLPQHKQFVLFSLERIRETVQNPVEQLSFSVGPIFLTGSLLFVVGCAAQTHRGYWKGGWGTEKEDSLVNIPFLVGALLFCFGCYAAVIETSNLNYSSSWHKWQNNGRQGDPPNIRLHPVPTTDTSKFISYYGCLIQFIGSLLFVVGAISQLVGSHHLLSKAVHTWLLDAPFLLGGFFFVAGAYLLVSEGSHSWWRGCVPPLRAEELKSVDYWVGILNWVGSLMFLGGGVEGFVSDDLTLTGNKILTAFTWLFGSVLFTVQGVVLYLEMLNHAW